MTIHIPGKDGEIMSGNCKQPKIGDVYLMKFTGTGSEQQGWRPGIVFSNNTGNMHSPNIIALPLTSSLKKMSQPTHVYIPAKENNLKFNSVVLCENPERMSKERIGEYITTINDKYMAEIAAAYLLSTSVISFLEPEKLMVIWRKAISLNTEKII